MATPQIPIPQPTAPIAASINGQSYSASSLNGAMTFTSIPPASFINSGPNLITCNQQGASMSCQQNGNNFVLSDCVTSAIYEGSQIVCQQGQNVTPKAYAQVPINNININNSWLWLVIILIIIYLLFVLYKKR